MYERGVTCFSCHDPHGSENESILRKPVNEVCASCHSPNSPNGPRAASIEAHTHHKADSTGSQCVACHMPKIEQTIANVNVSSHTFHFVTPAQTDAHENAERLQRLPHGQGHRMGDGGAQDVDRPFALAHGALTEPFLVRFS